MPAVRVCSDQRDKSIQEQSGCRARPGCWQLQALWSEIHHLQRGCLLGCLCLRPGNRGSDSSLLVLPLTATPVGRRDESCPNYKWKYPQWTEPSLLDTAGATYAPVSSLFAVYARQYKRHCQFLFFSSPRPPSTIRHLSEMRLSGDGVAVQLMSMELWSPSLQFSKCRYHGLLGEYREKKGEWQGLWVKIGLLPSSCS